MELFSTAVHMIASTPSFHLQSDDTNLVSLLIQNAPGLQVLSHDGFWVDVPVIPGTVVVNLGLVLSELTNGALQATVHRVNSLKVVGRRVTAPCGCNEAAAGVQSDETSLLLLHRFFATQRLTGFPFITHFSHSLRPCSRDCLFYPAPISSQPRFLDPGTGRPSPPHPDVAPSQTRGSRPCPRPLQFDRQSLAPLRPPAHGNDVPQCRDFLAAGMEAFK